MNEVDIRKVWVVVDETYRTPTGARDVHPLRKVAACAVVTNPFAGQGHVEDLSSLTAASSALGTLLGELCIDALGSPVESYGKAGIVGSDGEQEHLQAAVTSVFGDAFRAAIGGGAAWITSTGKLGGPGATLDVPLAYKDELWVRSHYDTISVAVPDAPLANELVVIAAVANRGRLDARVGGMTAAEAISKRAQSS